jgi:hypothetical protein
MPGIMGDHDIEGQFEQLVRILESPTWSDLWEGLGFTKQNFALLGLSENSPDVVVWETCQARQVVLVTGNRNNDGPDSLEATILRLKRADSLPVFTISDPQQFSVRSYAERAAERLLDYLLELDKFRGTGRLYIP